MQYRGLEQRHGFITSILRLSQLIVRSTLHLALISPQNQCLPAALHQEEPKRASDQGNLGHTRRITMINHRLDSSKILLPSSARRNNHRSLEIHTKGNHSKSSQRSRQAALDFDVASSGVPPTHPSPRSLLMSDVGSRTKLRVGQKGPRWAWKSGLEGVPSEAAKGRRQKS